MDLENRDVIQWKIMLNPEEIRQKLSDRAPGALQRTDFRRAAVLVPIFWRDGEPHVVFTKRSQKVPHHKGQISFPGGGIDATDAGPFEAAVRETHEEIGIPGSLINFLGRLDEIITVTHYVVAPFVAEIPADFQYSLSEFEIDELFDVSLRELADPAKLREQVVEFEGKPYPIYYFEHKGHNIWGATGKILRQLLSVTGVMPGDIPRDDFIPSDF